MGSHLSPSAPTDLNRLLPQVARSFALSVRVLPANVRPAVALGYLLARASDTIADSLEADINPTAGCAIRLAALDELQQAMLSPAGSVTGLPPRLNAVRACVPGVPSDAERRLLNALPQLLAAWRGLPPVEQALIGEVCATIFSGQRLDLERFNGSWEKVCALNSSLELDDYTWRVAGCVGHFWTHICEAHVPQWRSAEFSAMLQAGRRYGMGLQGLNLLRDSAADLAQGRCYWPAQTLAEVGLDPATLAHAVHHADLAVLSQAQPLMNRWQGIIRQDLSLGLAYSLAVRPWRLRLASALPALIGLRTLQDLQAAGPMALARPVKVPRTWVRGLLLRLALGGLTQTGLIQLGRQLGGVGAFELPPQGDGTMGA
ncbi:MAG: squalene/phytoene synthase family protein [Alphaproteobacteria bacterium]|nr:squalene/phytoene synthase family protein [Alphaproteobacteria bacterium]